MIDALMGVLRFSLAPLLRGEGRGEGLFPQAQTRGEPPSPGSRQARDPTSPRKRGEGNLRPRANALHVGFVVAMSFVCPSSQAQVETNDPGIVSGTLARIKMTGTVRLGYPEAPGPLPSSGP